MKYIFLDKEKVGSELVHCPFFGTIYDITILYTLFGVIRMFITRMIDHKEVMIELTEDEIYKAYQYQQYLFDIQYVMSRVKFDELHLVIDIAKRMRRLLNTFDYKEEEEAFQQAILTMEDIIVK